MRARVTKLIFTYLIFIINSAEEEHLLRWKPREAEALVRAIKKHGTTHLEPLKNAVPGRSLNQVRIRSVDTLITRYTEIALK